MLSVLQSNRLEGLVERLAGLLHDDPLPPLVPETIVVQSEGVARWLKLALAERLGHIPGLDTRFVEAGEADGETDGTKLFSALSAALADVPPDRNRAR